MVPTSVPALFLQAAGAAAGGRMTLLQGAAAGRALLLGPAASGRLALVSVGGGAKAPLLRLVCAAGGGINGSSSYDDDDDTKDQDLGKIIQEFSLGVVLQQDEDEELLDSLAKMAKDAGELLSKMMKEAPAPLPVSIQQELVLVGASFTEMEGHCDMGYISDTTLVAATRGVKRMAEIFLDSGAAEVATLVGKSVRVRGEDDGRAREDKTAYMRQLATTFSLLLRYVKVVYAAAQE